MTDRELMQWALDALEGYARNCRCEGGGAPCDAAEALRARLAQPEQEIESDRDHVEDDGCPTEKAVLQRFWREHQMQEPVAYDVDGATVYIKPPVHNGKYLTGYTAPPQREWVGLTDEEIREFEIWLDDEEEKHGWNPPADIVKYIEVKLKEKNAL